MLLLATMDKKNRKGLSVVIGYVLLIVISLVMSVIVFIWLKTYVPSDSLQCSDGTSVFIKDISYDCTNSILNITLENNGKFSIDGYFIHASNKTNEELATIDLSSKIIFGGEAFGNSISFDPLNQNSFAPGGNDNEQFSSFNLTGYGTVYRIEIIPTRFQEQNGKNRFVSCTDAKIRQDLACMT
jgi:hypothetical protein